MFNLKQTLRVIKLHLMGLGKAWKLYQRFRSNECSAEERWLVESTFDSMFSEDYPIDEQYFIESEPKQLQRFLESVRKLKLEKPGDAEHCDDDF